MRDIKAVTSRDNPTLKALVALAEDSREVRRQGRTLLIGPHLVEAYLQRVGMPERLVVSASGLEHAEVRRLLDGCSHVEALRIPDASFRKLSGGGTPVGILAVIRLPDAPVGAVEGGCVLLDAVQDAGNVGSILRTAAAAGIRDVVLGHGCAGAWTPRVLRAGQGAHFSLQIREHADLAEFLAGYPGVSAAAVVRGGHSPFETDLSGDVAWIFGNEGAGIGARLLQATRLKITIPLSRGTESLNVAAAAAICLFEGVRQKRLSKGGAPCV